MKSKTEKRSPLKDKPLRYAGQSLDDQILEKRDEVISNIAWTFALLIATAIAWISYLNLISVKWVAITILLATIISGITTIRIIIRYLREFNQLSMARDGEQLVAEGLQELIRQGAAVLNDIQGNRFQY